MRHFCQTLFLSVAFLAAASACPYAAETAGKGFPLRSSAQSAPVAATPSVPASQPAAVAQPGNFESQPIVFASGERRRGQSDDDRKSFQMPSILPALFAVLVVCGLFCTVLYITKKYLPGGKQLFSHPAMEVLGRTHLDQRRYVSLLRVGKRIIVVGVSPDEMRPLSEITDEAEITGIMEIARPKTEAGLTVFQRLFQRTVVESEAAQNRALAEEKTRQLTEQMSALKQRVAEMHQREAPEKPKGRRPVESTRKLDTVG